MKVSAIVLAAGASRRFGVKDKLSSDYRGRPLLYWALAALGAYDFPEVVLVTRDGQALPDLGDAPACRRVINPKADEGMASSIICGISALSPCDAAFVVLGDMPDIPPGLYAELVGRLSEGDIIQPVMGRRGGHPVLFARSTFDDIKKLRGDEGARSLMALGHYRVILHATDDPGIYFDIDVAGG